MRSHLPTIDETVDVDKGKASREVTDIVTKNSTRTHKPVRAFQLGDLVYRHDFDRKKTLRIDSLCEIIEIRNHGESYYIKDLNTDRIYLRNRSWIEPSETSLNETHQAKKLEVEFDENISHSIIKGEVHSNKRKATTSCLRSKNSTIKNNRVQFDSSIIIARCELISWRKSNK